MGKKTKSASPKYLRIPGQGGEVVWSAKSKNGKHLTKYAIRRPGDERNEEDDSSGASMPPTKRVRADTHNITPTSHDDAFALQQRWEGLDDNIDMDHGNDDDYYRQSQSYSDRCNTFLSDVRRNFRRTHQQKQAILENERLRKAFSNAYFAYQDMLDKVKKILDVQDKGCPCCPENGMWIALDANAQLRRRKRSEQDTKKPSTRKYFDADSLHSKYEAIRADSLKRSVKAGSRLQIQQLTAELCQAFMKLVLLGPHVLDIQSR
ncbi:hypothetical protein BJV82DRAFT_673424 [Fennellomyces sp. T-0311]|nr:hypothetical protein BJV82DRAFT_673424 [Fennellomyces sp. T-0311]